MCVCVCDVDVELTALIAEHATEGIDFHSGAESCHFVRHCLKSGECLH